MVARLGIVQSLEQLAQRCADGCTQCRKPLAGAGLDERAAYHEIDFAMRLGSRDQSAQALGVAAGRQALRLYTRLRISLATSS